MLLVGLAGLLFAAGWFERVPWWPAAEWGRLTVLLLPALIALLAVLRVVVGHCVGSALSCFLLLALANAAILLAMGAEFIAVANALLLGGTVVICLAFVTSAPVVAEGSGAGSGHGHEDGWEDGHDAGAGDGHDGNEPLLASVTGGLLAIGLVSAIHYALGVEAAHEYESRRFSALPRAGAVKAVLEDTPHRTRERTGWQTEELGMNLYVDHVVAVALTGVVLWTSVVGAALIVQSRSA